MTTYINLLFLEFMVAYLFAENERREKRFITATAFYILTFVDAILYIGLILGFITND